jgi:hypothetical protein
MSRKIRYGMIGGGRGAFIGGVHRIAAAIDQQIELVCGAFLLQSGEVQGQRRRFLPARRALLRHV